MRRRVAVLAMASALALTACSAEDGESGSDATTTQDATPAATETTAEATATDDGTVGETTGPTDEETAAGGGGEGEQLLAAAISAADGDLSARTRVTSSSQTPQGDIEVVAEGVQSGADSQMTMTMSGMPSADGSGEVTVEMIMLDGTIYQRSEMLTSQLGTDKQWISFDTDAMGEQFASQLEAAQSADPSQTLEVFRDAGSVEVVGEEDVNGVATTHLVVTIPLRAALEAQGLDESAVGGSGVDADQTVEYDLWIDGDDMMRRMAVDVEVQGVTTSTTVDVLEYGVDADIQAPPSDQVVSFSDMMGQAGNSGSDG